MPDGLTPRATVLLVALAFGLTFCVQALLGGGSSKGGPADAKPKVAAPVAADTPAAQSDVRLVAAGTVPALRDPRKPRKRRVRKPKRTVRKVVRVAPVAPRKRVVPTATARAGADRGPALHPACSRTHPAPAPKPKPTPPPASTPPDSGEFDTTGER